MLAIGTALSCELWHERPQLIGAAVLATTCLGAFRYWLGIHLKRCTASQLRKLKMLYTACILGMAVIWSIFASTSIALYGRSWTGIVVLLSTLGIVAGSTSNLTPNYSLMRLYILTMVVPPALTLASSGGRPEIATTIMMLFYAYMMISIGGRHCHRYEALCESVLELDISRGIAERAALELGQSQLQFRQLASNQQQTLEEERHQLSREVHDELGQLLTAIRLEVSLLERHCQAEAAQIHTDSINSLLDTTMTSVRKISSSLRPPLLDELGLRPALDWLLQSSCGRANIGHSLKYQSGIGPLSKPLSLTIFRICQEALTNVLRHSRATSVEVEISATETDLCLCVQDNGVGISHEQMQRSLGVLGMSERANLQGGRLEIEGQTGVGTCVRAYFPLSGEPLE